MEFFFPRDYDAAYQMFTNPDDEQVVVAYKFNVSFSFITYFRSSGPKIIRTGNYIVKVTTDWFYSRTVEREKKYK